MQFELVLPRGIEEPRRCNCSFCRMRGAVVASVALDGVRVTKGADKLTLLEGVNPYDLGEVPVLDGINQSSDRKADGGGL